MANSKYTIRHRWEDRTLFEGEYASLRDAVVAAVGARADLSDADLRDADLRGIRDDLYAVLAAAPAEVPGLLVALREGRIDGTAYEGECACLVGTIANLRHCDAYDLQGVLHPDSSRPAEKWFLAIVPGNTPENHPVAKIPAEWIEAWLVEHPPVAEAATNV